MLAYENVKAGILEYIKNNHLKSGDQLPTEKELSEYLEVGRLSLREGLNALKSEGIILSVRGKGTFVACSSDHIADTLNVNSSVTDMIRCSGYEPGSIYFEKQIVKADRAVSEALMVDEGIGYAVCFDKLVYAMGESGLCFRPLSPHVEAVPSLVWKKYQVFTKATSLFLQKLREHIGE